MQKQKKRTESKNNCFHPYTTANQHYIYRNSQRRQLFQAISKFSFSSQPQSAPRLAAAS
jgi:hypothetical protein